MIQAWQYRLLNNKPVVLIEYRQSGTYKETLQPGDYEIDLVGQGGGSANGLSTSGTYSYVCGGVAGTLRVRVSITQPTTITINLNSRNNSRTRQYTGVVAGWSGDPGGDTSITGIPGATLIAHGGGGGSFTPTSATGGTRVSGLQGLVSVSGVKKVLINSNDNVIISTNGQIPTTETRTSTGQLNSNYPDNPVYGAGGDGGRNGATTQTRSGMAGVVIIKSI